MSHSLQWKVSEEAAKRLDKAGKAVHPPNGVPQPVAEKTPSEPQAYASDRMYISMLISQILILWYNPTW